MGNAHVVGAGGVTNINGQTGNVFTGERNLLLNSNDPYINITNNPGSQTLERGKITVLKSGKFDGYLRFLAKDFSIPLSDIYESNKTCTFSFEMKASGMPNNSSIVLNLFGLQQSNALRLYEKDYIEKANDGKWIKYDLVFKLVPDYMYGFVFQVVNSDADLDYTGTVIEYRNFMINSPVSYWTPAPEDIFARASNASTSASDAAKSAAAAKTSQDAAKTSETAAGSSATAAKNSETAAKASQTAAANSAAAGSEYATQAKSYAVGDTGSREEEGTDNAKYYYDQAKRIAQGLEGALIPMGTITFSNLSTASKSVGYMYNISDAFTTNATFKEGPGHAYPAGTNVYYTGDGYWDCLAGYQVVSVNGRTGAVTVAKADVGLSNVDNTSDANKNVATANKLATPRNINGISFDGSKNINVGNLYVKQINNTDFRTYMDNPENVFHGQGNELNAFRFYISDEHVSDSSYYHLFTADSYIFVWSQNGRTDYINALGISVYNSNVYSCSKINGMWLDWTHLASINDKVNAAGTADKVGHALTFSGAVSGTYDGSKALAINIPTTSYPVTSVNSKTGAVSLNASDVGAVPTSRKVNNKALSADISLTASDVGALPSGGKAATAGAADTASYPAGFTSSYSAAAATWGNQTGTFVTGWSGPNDSSIQFRNNAGQLNELIDGFYYQREGKARVLDRTDRATLYSVTGTILNGVNTAIRGVGNATVLVEVTGLATIYFTVQITVAGPESNIFTFGLNRDQLHAINPSVPVITPLGGGIAHMFTVNPDVSNINGFGAGMKNDTAQFWSPSRVFDVAGNIGGWPSSIFSVGDRIVGVCFGIVG